MIISGSTVIVSLFSFLYLFKNLVLWYSFYMCNEHIQHRNFVPVQYVFYFLFFFPIHLPNVWLGYQYVILIGNKWQPTCYTASCESFKDYFKIFYTKPL